MKRKILTLTFLLVLLIMPSTMAASNQGLLWGIAEDQTITYNVDTEYATLSGQGTTTIMEESYQLIVTTTDLPEIPTDIADVNDLPIPTVSMEFGNGTETTETPPASDAPFVLPAGNWSLMDEIFMEIKSGWYTYEASKWGYYLGYQLESIYFNIEVRYTRSNGVLSYLRVSIGDGDGPVDDVGDFQIILEQAGSNDILEWIANHPTIAVALIGGVVAVVVIVGIVIFKVKRR